MRGSKGARASVLAVQDYGGTGYTLARLSLVAYESWTPKTPKQAMQAWWEHKPLVGCTVRSDLRRRLPASGGHVEKVVHDCLHRTNVNVVLRPPTMDKAVDAFVQELTGELLQAPEWHVHQRWLLPAVSGLNGGVFEYEAVPKAKRIVETGQIDVDGAWGLIQAWLAEVLPVPGLRQWYPRDEYLQRRQERIDRSNVRAGVKGEGVKGEYADLVQQQRGKRGK